ncbi:MAG: sulfite exporter TauE/SafE family protein [Candidatus Krumholzibacteriia bacterium]
MNPLHVLLLFAVGVVAGVLNVLAGGGSLLTLPVLIFLGLPAAVANGTNRVAILAQSVVSVGAFRHSGMLPLRLALLCTAPALLGGALGASLAVGIDDLLFRRILAAVMLAVCVVMIADPTRRLRFDPARLGALRAAALVVSFFVIGVYGGFIQAGVGFLIISALLVHGLDLVRVNAVKVFVVGAFTVTALAVFIVHDEVDWPLGLALAAGNALGGWLGTRLAIAKGHDWIRRLVLVTVVVFAVRLLWP